MLKSSPPLLYPGLLALLLAGCGSTAPRTEMLPPELPEQWQSADVQSAEPAPGWLQALNDEALEALVQEGLSGSYSLAEQRALVRQAEQSLVIAGAPLYPELDLDFDADRSGSGSGNAASGFDAGVSLEWELDLWGKLSDSERQANLTLAARQAELESARLGLVSDLALAWFELQAVEQRLALFSRRLSNLEQNLEIIESGYRLGLGSALDVYLARNDVQSEQARVEAQRQLRIEAVQALQLLLGRYPDGRWTAMAALPVLDAPLPAGVPGTLLRRRPDLASAWMELLAADAARAVAHKERFPGFSISASLGDSASRLPDLLSGSLAWSLAGGLTQPLFNAGRLKAAEAQAQARVEELEQQYLGLVFSAFAEVETTLSRAGALQQQYEQYLQAERTALLAEELSFAQYRKGLVEYSTVLEAQRRSLDAQSTVIGLRADLLTNRVALYRALGGDFAPADASSDTAAPVAALPSIPSAILSGDQDA